MEPPDAPPPEPVPVEPRPPESGFVPSRHDFGLTDLLSRASEAWSRDLGAWLLAMLLYSVIGFGIPALLGLFISLAGAFEGGAMSGWAGTVANAVTRVVQLVLSAIFTLGFWAMACHGLAEGRTRVGTLFSQLSKVWKYIVQAIVVGLGLVLLVAPILIVIVLAFVGPVDRSTPMSEIVDAAGRPLLIALGVLAPFYVYVLAERDPSQHELAYNDDAGPIDAIVYSWRIARGKRLWIILVGFIATLIVGGSVMLCGIGILFGAPFANLLFAALYLTLRDGADVPRANTTTMVGRPRTM